MIFLKLLLRSLICIVTIAIANPTDEESENMLKMRYVSNYILSEKIIPIHYKIQFQFTFEILYGDCEVTIYIDDPIQHIGFHIPYWMSIITSKLKHINKTVINEVGHYHVVTNDDNIVMLHFDEVLSHGMYILHIRFIIPFESVTDTFATFHINAYGKVQKRTEKWLIITGIYAKQKLPFWNKPELRVGFDISIMHHQRYKVLSNMPIEKYEFMENDMMLTYFYKSFFTIDNLILMETSFQMITNLDKTISMWCRLELLPYMKLARYVIKYITEYLNQYWSSSKYIFGLTLLFTDKKLDYVAISDLKDEVKQGLGFIFYREANIIYDKELHPVARKMRIVRLIAHGTVQKYMGNLLNPSYWFHQKLNEGFIMYFQEYIIEKALPNFRMMDLFIVQFQHELLNLNSHITINFAMEYDIYPEKDYSSFSHIKGSIIWRMLERTLPPNVFFMGIYKYLGNQLNNYTATTSNHLWDAMQSIMISFDFKYEFNIKNIMDSWAMQRCFPILKVKRDYFKQDIVNISVQFYDILDEKQYYIPITYTTESESNFTTTWTSIWLTPSHSTIEIFLEKNQWIIVNLQQVGYYRVYYDTENWRKIAQYLNSGEHTNIHVLNRAQIIDDAFHFAIEKKLNFSIFWELANYLSRERDYIAWYPMIKAFEFLSNIFPLLTFSSQFKDKIDKEKLNFKFIVQDIQLTQWKLYENNVDDYTECLKQELAKWKCIIDDSCKKWVNRKLKQHLSNPKKNKLLPVWKRWTYCNGLKMANYYAWEKVFQIYMNETDHTVLECLAYIENSEIIINYLEIKLPQIFEKLWHDQSYGDFELMEKDFAFNTNIFLFTLAMNTKYMLKDLLNNFKKIKHRRVDEIVALIVMINNVYSKEQLDEISKFVKEEIILIEKELILRWNTRNVISDITHKVETRWLEIQKQMEFFQFLYLDYKTEDL